MGIIKVRAQRCCVHMAGIPARESGCPPALLEIPTSIQTLRRANVRCAKGHECQRSRALILPRWVTRLPTAALIARHVGGLLRRAACVSGPERFEPLLHLGALHGNRRLRHAKPTAVNLGRLRRKGDFNRCIRWKLVPLDPLWRPQNSDIERLPLRLLNGRS